jgi:hypothetical protein
MTIGVQRMEGGGDDIYADKSRTGEFEKKD